MTGSGRTRTAAPGARQRGTPAGDERRGSPPARARVARKPRRPSPEPTEAEEDPRIALGQRVNRLRVALGLSQEEFADRVQLDRTYVSGIERGLRNPTLLVLVRLARALNVSPAKLIDND